MLIITSTLSAAFCFPFDDKFLFRLEESPVGADLFLAINESRFIALGLPNDLFRLAVLVSVVNDHGVSVDIDTAVWGV